MNFLTFAFVLLAAITARTGTFPFYAGGVRKTVTIVGVDHNLPLGRLTLAQASMIASQIASGSVSIPIRIGAMDYQVTVS